MALVMELLGWSIGMALMFALQRFVGVHFGMAGASAFTFGWFLPNLADLVRRMLA